MLGARGAQGRVHAVKAGPDLRRLVRHDPWQAADRPARDPQPAVVDAMPERNAHVADDQAALQVPDGPIGVASVITIGIDMSLAFVEADTSRLR